MRIDHLRNKKGRCTILEEGYEWNKPTNWKGIKDGSWVRVNWWPKGTYKLGKIYGKDVKLDSGGTIAVDSLKQFVVAKKKESRFHEHLWGNK